MSKACVVEAGRGSPRPGRRVVEFRARGSIATAVNSPSNENQAVGQQGRRVSPTCTVEIARNSPSPARRIVEFRASDTRENPVADSKSPCNEHLAVG